MNSNGRNQSDKKGETSSSNDLLNRLCNWYQSQCDGEWEHAFGIEVDTIDNPGWSLSVNLADTYLSRLRFKPITEGEEDDNYDEEGNTIGPWFSCHIVNNIFFGVCDPSQLPRLLSIFLDWADANRPADSIDRTG